MRLSSLGVTALLCMASSGALASTVISSYTAGTLSNPNSNYFGEQFTVTAAGNYNDVAFSFFSPSGAAVAPGTGYLFSAPFTGTESQLSSTSTNLLGTAAGSGGAYMFGSGVMLTGGDTYYLYQDLLEPANAIGGGFTAPAATAASYASSSGSTFSSLGAGSSWDYSVSADAVVPATVTPEPSSFALLGTGLVGVAGVLKRRFS